MRGLVSCSSYNGWRPTQLSVQFFVLNRNRQIISLDNDKKHSTCIQSMLCNTVHAHSIQPLIQKVPSRSEDSCSFISKHGAYDFRLGDLNLNLRLYSILILLTILSTKAVGETRDR